MTLYRLKLAMLRYGHWLGRPLYRRLKAVRSRPVAAGETTPAVTAGVRPRSVSVELIQRYTPGKSFADIGCMWGVNGHYSFLAERSGAAGVTAVDIYPASEEFERERRSSGSSIRFVQGDINSDDTLRQIGVADVVFCSGVLYHTPNPIHLLMRLRALCRGTLLLGTELIPEMPGLRNTAVFYPYLSDGQRALWNRHVGHQGGISSPYDPESGYGNWFWGMSPSCVESALKCAGFEVSERVVGPFWGAFVAQAVPTKFAPVSGDWTVPS